MTGKLISLSETLNDNETEPDASKKADEKLTTEHDKTDEDVAEWDVACDGCDAGMEGWSEPFYLCLICPNTDLCVACHEKRLAQDNLNSWKRFCEPDHRYIKGPMKGWRGIKDGVIRIEGDDPFTVKDWIKGLRDERWPKAWERYWLKQGGLKDIDVADQ